MIFVISINSAVSWRSFWKGRKSGGNLGHPDKFHFNHNLKESDDSSEDKWFEQKLDHFDPRSDKTWQQV